MFESLPSLTTVVISAVFASILAVWGYLRTLIQKNPNLPPGPPPELLLGNLRVLRTEKGDGRLRMLDEMGKKYNGMYTLYFGSQTKVVLTDYELIKRVLNEDIFTGRPRRFFAEIFFRRLGLLYSDGDLWKEHRTFAMKTLKDFGLGKPWLANNVRDEAQDLVRSLEATNGQPTNPGAILSHSAGNIICALAFGKRYDHKNIQFRRLTTLYNHNMQSSGKNVLVSYFPWLRHLPLLPFKKNYLAYVENTKQLTEFLMELITEHQQNFEPGEARDYIDAFLNEQVRQQEDPNSTWTTEQLEKSVLTLFGAGLETTATSISWTICYLIEHPEIMRKIREEVDANIPDGGFPTYEEKAKFPFLEATLMEVLRMTNPIPVPARRTYEPTELGGYIIPANITILPNVYSVHMNPTYFPNPKKFDPTRYLDATGKVKQVEGYLPFSVGKRFCYGKDLAKMELLIFVASIVKHFNFKPVPGKEVRLDDSVLGLANWPIPYEVIFEPRSAGRRFSVMKGVRQWDV